ncbi:MAG TPA: transglycosylase domain-containing protein, partial [Burkholderiales bacterium]
MARRARILRYFAYALAAGSLLAVAFVIHLDLRVRDQFEGRRFALPARIYARPLEVHAGLRVSQADVEDELRELGYRDVPTSNLDAGWYARRGGELEINVRAFTFWDGPQPARRIRVAFDGGKVARLTDAENRELPLARLEPLAIGGIYPAGNEDRVLVRLEEVPKSLVAALIATEDRRFYSHRGFDPRGMARAAWSALGSGRTQGGSTITQQLVKNTFLTQERTLKRKFSEWLISIALERRLTKDQVLELYLNDVWLGQRGSFAIHGVPEAARLFFAKDVANVSLSEAA